MAAARPLLPSSKVVASSFIDVVDNEDNNIVGGPPLTHKMPLTYKMTKSHKSSPGRQQCKNPSYRHNNNTKKKLYCNTPSPKSHSPSSLTTDNNIFKKIVQHCNINKSIDYDRHTKIIKIKRTDNNRDTHKITRIDLDEVSISSSCMTADEDIPSSKGRKKKNVSRSYHSAPSNLGIIRRIRLDYRLDPGRLGMDVTNDDYCIEGEYEVSKCNKGSRHRSHSFDCNYNTPIDDKYEDFGIERKLIELKSHKHSNHSRAKKQVRINNKLDENRKDDQQVYGSSSLWKTKVMSILRGGISGTTNKPNEARDEMIPGLIMASSFTPTSSEDEMECPLTPEETHLFFAWQHARFRNTTKVVVAPSPTVEAAATTRVNKKNYEDVLSIASSSGDKTIPMDNRKRQLRQGFSF